MLHLRDGLGIVTVVVRDVDLAHGAALRLEGDLGLRDAR